jgi:hypothetical protein
MARIPILGGAYKARGVIAAAQRCVNLYPERNPESAQSPSPVTHYQTPGLRLLGIAPAYPEMWRCLYRASNGEGFGVKGGTVYFIHPDWTLESLGAIAPGTSQCSMSDNGQDIVLVDGTINGYVINLTSHVFSMISDPAFYGADRVDYIDTFFVFNRPGTNQFYCSLSNSVSFDGLDIASTTGGSSAISAVIVKHREVWIPCLFTGEVWGNTGGLDFPFSALPGAFMDHGCIAKYSLAKYDVSIFWLSQDSQGRGIVMKSEGYAAKKISTFALDDEIQKYKKIDDAIGYIYQKGGHTFYALIFPAEDKTWVFDDATDQWHEWNWVDKNGKLHRHRSNCYANMYGENVVGDFSNGKLYALDFQKFTDDGQPIVRIRTFPHIVDDGNLVSFPWFIADIQSGTITGHASEDVNVSDFNWDFNADFGASPPVLNAPQLTLRYSDNRGQSFTGSINQLLGSTGQYTTSPKWGPLGMARDRVFELSWSIAAEISLNGAFLAPRSHRS